jgi:DNA-binding response OmpR family regulator
VYEWANVDEALAASASSAAPDLMLVDGRWESILALRKLGRDDKQPAIIALLGKDEASLRDVLRQAGVHTSNLPLSPARLRAMMMQLLLVRESVAVRNT